MKKNLTLLSLLFISLFIFVSEPKAYVVIDSTLGQLKPVEDVKASLLSNWGNQFGTSYNSGNDFQTYTSLGQFWYGGAVSGEYLDVVADYYVGFETIGPDTIYNYLPYSQNTLTAENLRCGIGDFRTGYDSTYKPSVTNFNVELSSRTYENIKQYQYHIKFNYHQRINPVVKSSTNLNCYFSVGTDKFFLQLKVNNGTLRIGYYNSVFNWSVSDDPNSKLLNEINNNQKQTNEKLDDLNNNQKQTNEKLDDLNNNINNDNVDSSQSQLTDFFNQFSGGDDKGLQDIINLPLQYVNNLSSSCKPIKLPLGQLGETTLPCLSTSVYNQPKVKSIIDVISVVINGLIMYKCLSSLLLFIHDLRDPNKDNLEVMDL